MSINYVVIENEGGNHSELEVDTAEQIAAVEKLLAERGLESAAVWVGEAGESVDTGRRIFAEAAE